MKTFDEYNPNKYCKSLILFDEIITDLLSN